jgi:hypothetical protein
MFFFFFQARQSETSAGTIFVLEKHSAFSEGMLGQLWPERM